MTVMARLAECQGPMIALGTACTASAHAIGKAFRHIQEGDARLMIAGGYDSPISYLDVLGFSLLGALASSYNETPPKASRPFERDRAGFVCETTALKRVFGQDAYRLAISSVKSMTGHLTAAAGGLNLLAAVGALRDQVVPPTINLDNPDPKLDLDYVPHRARKMRVRAAMLNAFAFGGTNASMVVRQAEGTRA
jgi:3-oxoacyl-(acyl-carrier-protein) synthase